jgi:AbrB family looped-hinge helix DNA binding protein
MITTINIDKAGRIVLPKSVRQELQIAPGDSLELESSDDHVVLRPARTKARMYKKHGIWVMNTGTPLAPEVVSDTIRKVREDRERSFLGK